jgi:HPt (histidine-containing phosphotransfer) domain-containing protein
MNGYVSKPIDRTRLTQEMQRVLSRQQAQSLRQGAAGVAEDAPDIDLSEALERLDGDREAMMEIALMFVSDCPARVAEIAAAVALRDAAAVSSACHNLAGTAANVSAHGLHLLAGKVSAHAAAGLWANADDTLAQLPMSLQRVENQLERWAQPAS